MKTRKGYINKNLYLQIAGVILIFIAVLANLSKRNMIAILGDEFGYWTAGAYFAGYDWSGIASMNGYFSFGYGILLAPLFLIKDASIMYKAAIVYNAAFLCGNFLLGYHSIKKISPKTKDEIILLFSFAASLYPTFLAYSKTNMAEVLLSFLFWLILFLILKLREKPTMLKAMVLGFFLAYIYSVHMRTIAVVLASVLYLIFLRREKSIKSKHLIMVIVVLGVLSVLSITVKQNLLDTVYINNEHAQWNDFSGQTGKLLYVLTPTGMVHLFESIMGKIFYLGAATYFLFYWYIICAVKNIKIMWKEKEDLSLQSIHLFLLLVILFTLGVSGVFTIYNARIDMLLYGRYNEHILGPVLVIGMLELMQNRKFSTCLKIAIFQLIAGIWVNHILVRSGVSQINSATIVGIYQNMVEKETGKLMDGYLYLVAIKSAIAAALIDFVMVFNKKWSKINACIVSLCFICLWFHAYRASYICQTIKSTASSTGCRYTEAYHIIQQSLEDGKNIYYTYREEEDNIIICLWSGRLQFLVPDSKIKVIEYEELKNIDRNQSILLVSNNSYVKDEVEREYHLLAESDDITIFN